MASYNHYQSTSSATWTITHNLNSKFVAIDVMRISSGGMFEKVMPQSVQIVNDNTISVKFPTAQYGRARIVAPNH